MALEAPSAGFGEGCNPRVVARILLGKSRERFADVTAWLVMSGTEQETGSGACVSDRDPRSSLRIATAPLCYGITLATHNQP